MDSDEDSGESASSDNDKATYESEHTVPKVTTYFNPDLELIDDLPYSQTKKRKKNKKTLSSLNESKRQKLGEESASICPSITQDSGNVQEDVSATECIFNKVQSDSETKTISEEPQKMVFGLGKNPKEFDKTDRVNTTRLPCGSLFQLNEDTEKPTINESNKDFNLPISYENVSHEDMAVMNYDTETTHTNVCCEVETGFKMQTRSMTKETRSQSDYDNGDMMVS